MGLKELLSCYFPPFPSIFLKSFCIVVFSHSTMTDNLPLNAKKNGSIGELVVLGMLSSGYFKYVNRMGRFRS